MDLRTVVGREIAAFPWQRCHSPSLGSLFAAPSLAESSQLFRREGCRGPFIVRDVVAYHWQRDLRTVVGREIAALPRQRCHSPSVGSLFAAPSLAESSQLFRREGCRGPLIVRPM